MRVPFLPALLTIIVTVVAPAAQAQQGPPRFEAGPVFSFLHQVDVNETNQFQFGGRFSWNLGPHFDLDAELTASPFAPVAIGIRNGGHITEGLLGARYGKRWERLGLFIKVRPGFVHYSSVTGGLTGTTQNPVVVTSQITAPAFDLGGIAEVYLTRHVAMRYDLGDTKIWYGNRYLAVSNTGAARAMQFVPGAKRNAFQFSTGVVYCFGRNTYVPTPPRQTSAPFTHRFWDKDNAWLFAGVGALRALDMTSTLNLRRRGIPEIFLTNSIADNHAAFAAIEAAGAAASIGASYLLHRTGYHRLERWVSGVHIAVTLLGVVGNYATPNRHGVPPPSL